MKGNEGCMLLQKDALFNLDKKFTTREKEALIYMSRGCSNREIALKMEVSTNTSKIYLRQIYCKMGVTDRTEAVVKAIKNKIIKI